MRKLVLVLVLLLVSTKAYAQLDPCTTAAPPFVVNTNIPFTLTFLMDAQVPVSTTDPTLVNQRIDGFYFQIDSLAEIKIGATFGAACTNVANKIPYSYRTLAGISRGNHTAKLTPFNFVLDAIGLPTTVEQRGPIATVPFAAVDLTNVGPPLPPTNLIIKK